MRIIGVELRLEYSDKRIGRRNIEIGIIPCHIDVEVSDHNYGMGANMNATIHTDRGDIAIQYIPLPEQFLFPVESSLKTQQKQ